MTPDSCAMNEPQGKKGLGRGATEHALSLDESERNAKDQAAWDKLQAKVGQRPLGALAACSCVLLSFFFTSSARSVIRFKNSTIWKKKTGGFCPRKAVRRPTLFCVSPLSLQAPISFSCFYFFPGPCSFCRAALRDLPLWW